MLYCSGDEGRRLHGGKRQPIISTLGDRQLADLEGPHCVAVTGLLFEARIAAGPRVAVICSGSQLQLKRAIEAAARRGCSGIISFGIAGGLAPHLAPGAVIIGRNIISEHGRYTAHYGWAESLMGIVRDKMSRRTAVSFGDIAGVDAPIACVAAKRSLHERSGAVAVDTESHVAARIAEEHRIPFAAFRVITDPVNRALPPAALVATRAEGSIDVKAVARSLLRQPGQLPTLVRLAMDSWAARQALAPSRRFLGPNLGFPDLREQLLDVA
jgi:adenosylhomocysteine nucleosidase